MSRSPSPADLYRANARIADNLGRAAARHVTGEHRDDLIQAAHLGLWVACLKWDETKSHGGNFTAYAIQRVRWAVADGWRVIDHMGSTARRNVKAGTSQAVTLHELRDEWLTHDDPADTAATRADAAVALWHLACLPSPMRHVFARYAINGETLTDIARDYGKSDAWAYSLRRQAVAELRRRLG